MSINFNGFTPMLDELVDRFGLVRAAIFGSVWRYCQMQDGQCYANLDRIASRAGVTRRTVITHLKALCDDGYLEDLTPEVRNKPHIYRDTGKVQLSVGVKEIHSNNGVRGERDSQQNDFGVKEFPVRGERDSLEDSIKIPLNTEDTKRSTSKDETDVSPSFEKLSVHKQSQAMFTVFSDLCGFEIGPMMTEKMRGQVNQAEKRARDNGITPDEVREFKDWWYMHDWRGKQGGPPTLTQARETWGKFRGWQRDHFIPECDLPLENSPPDLAELFVEQMRLQGITAPWLDTIHYVDQPNGHIKLTINQAGSEYIKRLKRQVDGAIRAIDEDLTGVEWVIQ